MSALTAGLAAALAVGATAIGGLVGAPAAGAWPGDPDGAWGACGLSRIDVTTGEQSQAMSGLLDGSGRYVVAGWVGSRAFVAAVGANGKLDATFGSGGSNSFAVGDDATLTAITPQVDGKLVVVGTRTMGDSVDSLLARLTTAGQLDSSFHGNGTLVMDLATADRLTSVRVQTNGAIVAGGSSGAQGLVTRVTSVGVPDTSFDGDGKVTGLPLTVQTLALQPDGKILIGGRSAANDFAIMRLNGDGSVDATFGGATGVQDNVGGYDSVSALALDLDGRVVATGMGHGPKGSGHTIVRRYNPDGTRDLTFSRFDRAFGLDDKPAAIAVRLDGKIFVAGNSKVGADNDVLLMRLNPDGTRDQTFGIAGVSLQDAGSRPMASGLVLRPNGGAVVVGSLRADDRQQLGLLAYQGDASTAPQPAQGYVIARSGGLFGFAAGCATKPPAPVGNPAWTGRDLARGVAVLPGGRGLVLDPWGGLRWFHFGDGVTTGLGVSGNARWTTDMARGVAIVPEGTGGYVVDKSGGLHPFKIGAGPKPPVPTDSMKWPGQDVARGIALLPNGLGGYVLDAAGGLHRFGGAPVAGDGAPSWPGQDRARGVTIAPDGSGGWVVDSSGVLYPFGLGVNPRPQAAVGKTWPGQVIARGVVALP